MFARLAAIAVMLLTCSAVHSQLIPMGETAAACDAMRAQATAEQSDAMAELSTAAGSGWSPKTLSASQWQLASSSISLSRGDAWYAEGAAGEAQGDTRRMIAGYRNAWLLYGGAYNWAGTSRRWTAAAQYHTASW